MAKELPENFHDLEKVRTKIGAPLQGYAGLRVLPSKMAGYLSCKPVTANETGLAAVRIAVEMQRERLMNQETALLKIPAESIDSLLVPVFDSKALKAAQVIGHGLPAGPGAATGRIAFTAAAAELEIKRGNKSSSVPHRDFARRFERNVAFAGYSYLTRRGFLSRRFGCPPARKGLCVWRRRHSHQL